MLGNNRKTRGTKRFQKCHHCRCVYGSKAKRNINTYRGVEVRSMHSVSRQQIKSLQLYTRRKYPRRDRLTGDLGGPQRGFGRFRNETKKPPPPSPPSAIERGFASCPSCSIATIIRKIQNLFLFVECSGRHEELERVVL